MKKQTFNIRVGVSKDNTFLYPISGDIVERNRYKFFVHHFVVFKKDDSSNVPIELSRWWTVSDHASGCGVLLSYRRLKTKRDAVAELDKMIAEMESYLEIIDRMSQQTVKRLGVANK